MTTETLLTDGQPTPSADPTQAAAPPVEGQPPVANAQPPAADAPPAEGAKPEGEPPKPAAGAPEKYEFAAPEGRQYDPKMLETYAEAARELNLPQDAAQKMLDKLAPAVQARQAEQLQAAREAWAGSTRADKEFGGAKLDENLATAKKALDTFGTPELRALLNESGLGNHPEVIRAFYRAGKSISEDRFVGGRASPGDSRDVRTLYPNSNLN